MVLLDGVRAVAILLVMMHHFRHTPGCPEWLKWFGLRGYVGVDIFFVLSGWLVGGQLMRTLRETGSVDVTRFWFRRWMRTLPVYGVTLGLFWATGWVDVRHPFLLAIFVQNYLHPGEWLVTWSLCIEEHFYLVLPLLVMVLRAVAMRSVPVAVGVVALLVLGSPVARAWVHPQVQAEGYMPFLLNHYVRTHLRLDGLFMGAALAAVWTFLPALQARLLRHARALAACGLVLAVGTAWNPWFSGFTSRGEERMAFLPWVPGFTLVSLGTLMLIPWCVRPAHVRAARRMPVATFIAEHAHTLYLVHEVARNLCFAFLKPYALPFVPLLAAAVASSLGMAVVLRRAVEGPVLRVRDAALARWSGRDAPAP